MQKDENISSFNSRTKQNLDFSLTFVGFKNYLVINFLKYTMSRYNVRKFVFLTSVYNIDSELPNNNTPNYKILKEAIDYIRKNTDKNSPEPELKILHMTDIWDFFSHIKLFSSIRGESAVFNISAGPSVYSSAAIVWAIKNNYRIAYSIENHHHLDQDPDVVFKEIDLMPYINFLFNTDNVDRLVIEAVHKGCRRTSEIRDYLYKLEYKFSLKTIENRINELRRKNILQVSGEKFYTIILKEIIDRMV